MPYRFQPGRMYRMPTHFGPSLGPRQGEDGRRFDNADSPRTTTRSVSFLTEHAPLEALLPEGFTLGGEPVVTVTASYITDIEWLAGRGYNTLGVSFPAVFRGRRDYAEGHFLTVLWENLADPIITGREELGFAKVYGELPEPRVEGGTTHCQAGWLGFTFLDMTLRNLTPAPLPPAAAGSPAATGAPADDGVLRGILHYKYLPRTGEWGGADAAYATLTPAATSNRRVVAQWHGEGMVQFHRARWEDLPTLVHIVNAFADLEIIEYLGASVVMAVGGKDLSDQRILC